MGYALAYGPCLCCRRTFSFNPVKVPSKDLDGRGKQPICPACMGLLNAERQRLGREPFPIDPEAYKPCDEAELS